MTPPEPLSPQAADALAQRIGAALARDLGGAALPNPEGWGLAAAGGRFLMGRHLPVVELARAAQTLAFIVTPADPAARVYKRTPRYDVVYFSEDVPDDAQHVIYARDRATIERVAAWLVRWDSGGAR